MSFALFGRTQRAVLFAALISIMSFSAGCKWSGSGTTCDYDCGGWDDGGGDWGGGWDDGSSGSDGGSWGGSSGSDGGSSGSDGGSSGSDGGSWGGSSGSDGGGYALGYCDASGYCMGSDIDQASRDLTTSIAEQERLVLENSAKHYASKFSLSEEQGLKIAKTLQDYSKLKTRSDADVADFAKRLYGIEPSKIILAVGQAQLGNPNAFNGLVTEAAANFNTTPENMRAIVKTIHGKLLDQQGISF